MGASNYPVGRVAPHALGGAYQDQKIVKNEAFIETGGLDMLLAKHSELLDHRTLSLAPASKQPPDEENTEKNNQPKDDEDERDH